MTHPQTSDVKTIAATPEISGPEICPVQSRLESEMRRAIEKREFELYFQPIIDLPTGIVRGMEALVRWNHPEQGLISPAEFIPLAEESGLILQLGHWILEDACISGRDWQVRYPGERNFSMTVNVSCRQFHDESLVTSVMSATERSGLPPQNLTLEITENTILYNRPDTEKKLKQLKKIGVRIAIDDFGTGYSSLGHLQSLPLDILKIDRSFIGKVCQGRDGAAVTRAVITLGNILRLETIAEGIESKEQVDALQELGCKTGQGYHIARPMTSKQMEQFLSENDPVWMAQRDVMGQPPAPRVLVPEPLFH